MGSDKAMKLLLVGPSSMKRFVLHFAKRRKLALILDDPFNAGGAEAPNQLVLEVGDAHIEAERFQSNSIEIASEASLLETSPEVTLLGQVV